MWEYPCRALAKAQTILTVEFNDFFKTLKNNGSIRIEQNGTCNGIVCWVDWFLEKKETPKALISTGPNQPIQIGQYISWNMFTNQGIHLIPKSSNVNSGNNVEWETNFQPKKGELLITFNVK